MVKILDPSPALELLVDADGAVNGATGINRQTDEKWRDRVTSHVQNAFAKVAYCHHLFCCVDKF